VANTTSPTDQLRMSFPILKMDETPEGDLIVFGKATDASLDSDEQIVDQKWSAKAIEDWLTSGANVRVQHSPFLYPAGKGIEVQTSDDGHYVKALVVEDNAKKLCRAGVLQAFSIGISQPKVIHDSAAKNGRIVGGSLAEISLVDRPANANCGFKIVKSADGVPVDTEEMFGNLQEALEAAEKTAEPVVEKSAEGEFPADLLAEWAADRDRFVNNMPDVEEPEAWRAWKSEKDLYFAGTDESRTAWLAKREGKTVEPEVEKGQKDCPSCGASYDGDSKLRNCAKCDADLPHADKSVAEPEEEKAKKPAPDQKKPPFGGGNQADPDGDGDNDEDEDEANAKKKGEMPYTVKRLHDVLCPVYSDGAVSREYASLKSWNDAINVDAVRTFLGDEAGELASDLKAADPDMLADARAQLHKAFADMYPTAHVSPTSMSPGRFRRGYLSSGHQRENATGSDSGARIPTSNQRVDASQFNRGPLTSGQERPSPGNKRASGVSPEYAAGSAAFTRNMLQNLHDHITDTRSEVCPLVDRKSEIPADMHAGATLTPVTPPKGAGFSEEFLAKMDALVEKSARQEDQIAVLQAAIDELGAQPDPALAPVRGVVAKSADSTVVTPVERTSSVERREPTEDDRLKAYALARINDGDPAWRKMAYETLEKLGHKPSDED